MIADIGEEENDDCTKGAGTALSIDLESLSGLLSAHTLSALKSHVSSTLSSMDENSDAHEMPIRSVNSNYRQASYWDERFSDENSYEWLLTFGQLEKYISPFVSDYIESVLIVGCGNSMFSVNLYDRFEFNSIVNIDFSDIVIEKMKLQYGANRPKMTWVTMDMLDLKFSDTTFDLVIDKATMDALMVDEGDVWNPDCSVISSANDMCSGISRVLKPGGIFLQISFAQPHFRTKYLMHTHGLNGDSYSPVLGHCSLYSWTLSYMPIELESGCLNYFMYVMTKDKE